MCGSNRGQEGECGWGSCFSQPLSGFWSLLSLGSAGSCPQARQHQQRLSRCSAPLSAREGAHGCTPGAVDPGERLLMGMAEEPRLLGGGRNGFYAAVKHRGLAAYLCSTCVCVCVWAHARACSARGHMWVLSFSPLTLSGLLYAFCPWHCHNC